MRGSFLVCTVFVLTGSTVAAQLDPEQCGPLGGNQICKNNKCCSQYGWCGTANAYCRAGCNPSFGRCVGVTSSVVSTLRTSVVSRASTLSTLPSPSPSPSPSPVSNRNERCGPNYGRTSCLGSIYGSCCSQYGWCGATTGHCKAGCQSAFGTCSGLISSSGSSSRVSGSSSQSTARVSLSSSIQAPLRSSGSFTVSTSSTTAPRVISSSSTQLLLSSSAPPRSSTVSTVSSSSSSASSTTLQVVTPSNSLSTSVGNIGANPSSTSTSVTSSSTIVSTSSSPGSTSVSSASSSPAASPSASDVPRIFIPARNPDIDRTSPDRLVPAHVLTLYYVEQSPGTAARVDTITLAGDLKGILLEDINAVDTVTCSGSSISIALTDEASADIARAWPAGTLLYTSVDGCGPASRNERGVYSIRNGAIRRTLGKRQLKSVFTAQIQAVAVPFQSQIGSVVANLLLDRLILPTTLPSTFSQGSLAAPLRPSTAAVTTSKPAPATSSVPQLSSETKAGLSTSRLSSTVSPSTSTSAAASLPAVNSDIKAPLSTPVDIPSTPSSTAATTLSLAIKSTLITDSTSLIPGKDLSTSKAPLSSAVVDTLSSLSLALKSTPVADTTSSTLAKDQISSKAPLSTPTSDKTSSTLVKTLHQPLSTSASTSDTDSKSLGPVPSATPSFTAESTTLSIGSASQSLLSQDLASSTYVPSGADSTKTALSTADSASPSATPAPSSDETSPSGSSSTTSPERKGASSSETPVSSSSRSDMSPSSLSRSSTPTPSPGPVYSNFCLRVLTSGRNGDFVVKQSAPATGNGGFYLESAKISTSLSVARFSIDAQGVLFVNTPGTVGTVITRYSNGSGARFLWQTQSTELSFNTCTVRKDVTGYLGAQVLKCSGGNNANYKFTAFTPVVQTSGPDRLYGAIETSVDGSITPADPSTLIELQIFSNEWYCPDSSIT